MLLTNRSVSMSPISNSIRRARVMVTVFAIVGAVAMCAIKPVQAADQKFASVDLAKVFNSSNAKKAADDQMQKFGQSLQVAFQGQSNAYMLGKADLTTLGTLLMKPTPTDTEKQSIQKLQDQSKKDADQLTALQQKKDLTDNDKIQLQLLTAQAQAGQQALQDINNDYRSQLDAKSQELNGQISAQMKTVIASVAQKQNITVVFDSTVAVYATIDITNDVIAGMNK